MFDRLDDILIRFEELLHELGDPVLTSDPEKFRRLMKEQAELAPLHIRGRRAHAGAHHRRSVPQGRYRQDGREKELPCQRKEGT